MNAVHFLRTIVWTAFITTERNVNANGNGQICRTRTGTGGKNWMNEAMNELLHFVAHWCNCQLYMPTYVVLVHFKMFWCNQNCFIASFAMIDWTLILCTIQLKKFFCERGVNDDSWQLNGTTNGRSLPKNWTRTGTSSSIWQMNDELNAVQIFRERLLLCKNLKITFCWREFGIHSGFWYATVGKIPLYNA